MDTETKEKLTEQQHQIEMLRTETEASMKTMKAENESAIERLRTDMERNVNVITIRVIGAVGLLGVFITILQFFK